MHFRKALKNREKPHPRRCAVARENPALLPGIRLPALCRTASPSAGQRDHQGGEIEFSLSFLLPSGRRPVSPPIAVPHLVAAVIDRVKIPMPYGALLPAEESAPQRSCNAAGTGRAIRAARKIIAPATELASATQLFPLTGRLSSNEEA